GRNARAVRGPACRDSREPRSLARLPSWRSVHGHVGVTHRGSGARRPQDTRGPAVAGSCPRGGRRDGGGARWVARAHGGAVRRQDRDLPAPGEPSADGRRRPRRDRSRARRGARRGRHMERRRGGDPIRPPPRDTDSRADGTVTKVNEPGPQLGPDDVEAILAAASAVAGSGWIVGCGSLPPGAPVDFYARLAALGSEQRRIAVDTSGEALGAAVCAGTALV